MRSTFFLMAISLFGCSSSLQGRADRMVLDTAQHTLTLYRGQKELATYTVGLGSNRSGKRRLGDRRTPVGRYRLMRGRASRKYLRFLPISYPNVKDAARGLKAGLITKVQHDAIVAATKKGRMPPQNTKLGGAIGIHGLPKSLRWLPDHLQIFHRTSDVTAGCVLVTDAEVASIEEHYVPGAILEILPPK